MILLRKSKKSVEESPTFAQSAQWQYTGLSRAVSVRYSMSGCVSQKRRIQSWNVLIVSGFV